MAETKKITIKNVILEDYKIKNEDLLEHSVVGLVGKIKSLQAEKNGSEIFPKISDLSKAFALYNSQMKIKYQDFKNVSVSRFIEKEIAKAKKRIVEQAI